MAHEDYVLYKKLLLKLHEMTVRGTDQTEAADSVRDKMDGPGSRLTALEHERISGLASDLYMLTGEEVKVRSDTPLSPQQIETIFHLENSDRILEVLRKSDFRIAGVALEEHSIACLRALCWYNLGEYDVSLLFAEYAAKLKPENLNYANLVLLNRRKLGQVSGANATTETRNFSPQQAIHELIVDMGILQTA